MKPAHMLAAACVAFWNGAVATAGEATHPPAAPKISCQISMPVWCITMGPEKITLSGDAHRRIWTMEDRVEMNDGPLTIIESESNCADPRDLQVHKLYERAESGYLAVAFAMSNGDQCRLEFRLPMKDGKVDDIYRSTMLYTIMIGGKQLYTYDQP